MSLLTKIRTAPFLVKGGLAIIALIILGGAYMRFAAPAGKHRFLSTFTVQPGTIQQTVQAPATVTQPATVNLTFPSSQATPILTFLSVQPGDQVTAGQVIAREDSSILDQTVVQARASLAASQANLEKLTEPLSPQTLATYKAQLEQADATWQAAQSANQQSQADDQSKIQTDQQNLQNDQNTLAGDENLAGFSNGQPIQTKTVVGAEATVATDKTNLLTDQNALNSLASTLAQAKAAENLAVAQYNQNIAPPDPAALAAAEAAVEQAQSGLSSAQLNAAKATMTAPFTGNISAVNYTVGDVVTAATPVVTLVPTGGVLQLHAEVSEANIAQLQVGQTAVFVPDANPSESFQGQVTAVSTSPTVTQNVTQYQVNVSLPSSSSQGKLIPGMTGTVNITVAQANNVLYVPATALLTGAHPAVYVAGGKGSFRKQPVSTGLYNGNDVQVTAGLRSGQKVLTYAYLPGGGGSGGGGNGGAGAPKFFRALHGG